VWPEERGHNRDDNRGDYDKGGERDYYENRSGERGPGARGNMPREGGRGGDGGGRDGGGREGRPYRSENGDGRRDYGDRPDYQERERRERPARPPVPFPTEPPFTAYVGNLVYDISENDIADFFEPECKVKNVRMMFDKGTGRPKGFGYVIFEDAESLKSALSRDGQDFMGRPARIDVAEARPEGDRPDRGQNRGRDGGRSFFADREKPRDEPARWGHEKFDDRERGPPRERGERARPPFDREHERGHVEDDDRSPGNRGGGDRERWGGPEKEERRDRPPRDDPPPQRKPLALAPRTVPLSEEQVPSPTSPVHAGEKDVESPKTKKSNPFGAARPRDEKEWLKKLEEREKEKKDKDLKEPQKKEEQIPPVEVRKEERKSEERKEDTKEKIVRDQRPDRSNDQRFDREREGGRRAPAGQGRGEAAGPPRGDRRENKDNRERESRDRDNRDRRDGGGRGGPDRERRDNKEPNQRRKPPPEKAPEPKVERPVKPEVKKPVKEKDEKASNPYLALSLDTDM